jgi:hypothetical protein
VPEVPTYRILAIRASFAVGAKHTRSHAGAGTDGPDRAFRVAVVCIISAQ